MSEANKEVVRRVYYELFNNDRFELIPELYCEDCVARDPANTQTLNGHDTLLELLRAYRTALPNHQYEVLDLVAEGDKVCIRWMVDVDTERDLEVEGLSIVRFRDGRICEIWQHWDNLGLLKKLGAVDPDVNVADAVSRLPAAD